MLRYADSLNEQAAKQRRIKKRAKVRRWPSAICQIEGATGQMMARKNKLGWLGPKAGTVNASKR